MYSLKANKIENRSFFGQLQIMLVESQLSKSNFKQFASSGIIFNDCLTDTSNLFSSLASCSCWYQVVDWEWVFTWISLRRFIMLLPLKLSMPNLIRANSVLTEAELIFISRIPSCSRVRRMVWEICKTEPDWTNKLCLVIEVIPNFEWRNFITSMQSKILTNPCIFPGAYKGCLAARLIN